MHVHEYREVGSKKWCYQVDGEEFCTDLRHSMQSLKKELNCDSLSVTVNIGTGVLYGGMRFNKRTNKPNYNIYH